MTSQHESDQTKPLPLESRRSVLLTRRSAIAAVAALLVIGAVGTVLWSKRPRLSQEDIRDAIYSTIQREAPASFLVTGYIDVTTTTRVENTRTVLPGILDLDLGTTSALVRVPGRVSYGFDVRELDRTMIRLLEDDVVEVVIPSPSIYSVEPNLEQLEVETRRGWARTSAATTESVRSRAIELVQGTMRAQGEQHLRGSQQPHINTANALYRMLRPVLIAAGIENPQLRFRVGDSITIEPGRAR
jgi:hypothetical protein